MKILITGGAGFIGSNLALELVEKKHDVIVLDNLSKQIHGDEAKKTSPLFKSIEGKVKFIEGDVTNRADWEKVILEPDVIVHFAAETGTGQSMYQIEKYTNVNIGGTAIMLDLLANNKNHNVKKIIIASSRSIYGEGKYYSEELGEVYPEHRIAKDMDNKNFDVKFQERNEKLKVLPTDEESKIHPSSIYGITKQNQEQMVLCACKSLGIKAIAFRYQNVYGPGQSLTNPYTGILSIFSTLIRNNKNINVFEDGLESRDFVYVSDVVDATILGIENDTVYNEIFNVGSGEATDVTKVAKTLVAEYNSTVSVEVSGNYRLGDIRHNYADLTKVKNQLGFSPKVFFEEGIKRFVVWVKEQEVGVSRYNESILEMKEKGLFK